MKIQAFFRARKARDDYRMLGKVPGFPPLSVQVTVLVSFLAFNSERGRKPYHPVNRGLGEVV